LSDVLASLGAAAARGSAFAGEVAAAIRTRSPTSVAVTFRQVRQGASLSFEDCMRLELRIAEHMIRGHDFYEGVRAVILDKDNAPRWNPATIEALSGNEIDRYFQPTPDSERLFE
jgi:enoyl-CoA hydratase